ncbi:hypothetical protein HPB51_010735 [Rhipicephalus microplus]|uniref:Uncharacterized protein n=1 Tax=Rhipicephalus microplus TaxID=6941 RepID=A0A9J6DU47_RHIMP|nr:hypothetical protein HPB51_010735 [Rhipicephalus microplus]
MAAWTGSSLPPMADLGASLLRRGRRSLDDPRGDSVRTVSQRAQQEAEVVLVRVLEQLARDAPPAQGLAVGASGAPEPRRVVLAVRHLRDDQTRLVHDRDVFGSSLRI